MNSLYRITHIDSGKYYIGITSDLARRFAAHRHMVGKINLPLYNAINKYGWDKFSIQTLFECSSRVLIEQLEKAFIKCFKPDYNIAPGGEGGFCVPDTKLYEWRNKLREKRQGKTPFLGHKHTDETKELCRAASLGRWETYEKYPANEVVALPFKEAHAKFGISKTHYYRLRKQND